MNVSLEEKLEEKLLSLVGDKQLNQGAGNEVFDQVRVSTKGFCSIVDHNQQTSQYELYVNEDPLHVAAIGQQMEEGLTIHGVPLQSDWTCVVVDEVRQPNVQVPQPRGSICRRGCMHICALA